MRSSNEFRHRKISGKDSGANPLEDVQLAEKEGEADDKVASP